MNNKKAKQNLKLLLIIGLFFVGISFANSDLSVQTDKQEYELGQPVIISTTNNFASYIRIANKDTRWEFKATNLEFHPTEIGEYEVTALIISNNAKIYKTRFTVIDPIPNNIPIIEEQIQPIEEPEVNTDLIKPTNPELISETLTQLPAETGKPVKWIKKIRKEISISEFSLPEEAQNIIIKKSLSERSSSSSFFEFIEQKNKKKRYRLLGNENEIEIEYSTPPPKKIESIPLQKNGKYIKDISINSSFHYQNILTSTKIKESKKEKIKLYWLVNNSKIDVTDTFNITYHDTNNNNLIDELSWIIPHLSEQNFSIEINITVINIQSYPTTGKNWTVRFTTEGKADLKIKTTKDTTWSINNESEDLKFLEIYCGNNKQNYIWDNNTIIIQNYECNETGTETSKVITSGKHHLEFDFGGIKAYANNEAGPTGFKTYHDSFTFPTASGSTTQSIGDTIDMNHSFLIVYSAGSQTPNTPDEGAIHGYISSPTEITFARTVAQSGVEVSWFIVEALDSEFTIRGRGELNFAALVETDTDTLFSNVTNMSKVMVVSGSSNNTGSAAGDWEDAFIVMNLTSNSTIQGRREAASDGTITTARYEVVEWRSDYNVYTGEITVNAQEVSDLISGSGSVSDNTINMSRSFILANWWTPNNGIQQVQNYYYINDTNEIRIGSYSAAYNNLMRWYVVESPPNHAFEVERWAYNWNPTTSPGDVRTNDLVTTVDTSRTFMTISMSVSGTGTAFKRDFSLPRLLSSTQWSETQYNPSTNVYDQHETRAQIIQLPYVDRTTIPPNVTLLSPLTNSFSKNRTINFTFNVTTNDDIANCSVWTNETSWSLKTKNSTPITAGEENGINHTFGQDGYFSWNIECSDSEDNADFSPTNYTIRIDTVLPSLNIQNITPNPSNHTINNVIINWSASDQFLENSYINISFPNGTFLGQYANNFTLTTTNLSELGNYTITAWANDSAGNENISLAYLIVEDVSPPLITLVNPNNNEFWNNNTLIFSYNVSDASLISNCSLVLYGDTIIETNNTINKSITNTFSYSSDAQTTYLWSINCTDNSSYYNGGNSSQYSVTVDSISPDLTLTSPYNNYFSNSTIIQMNYTPSDTYLESCLLFGNFSGNWQLNQTTHSPNNNLNNAFNFINLNDGNYIWNVYCNDSASNLNGSLTNYTLNIDTNLPSIEYTQPTPQNNSNQTLTTLTINVTHTELNPEIAILKINSQQNKSKQYSGPYSNFTLLNLDDGIYTFSVSINDSSSNINETETRLFRIDTTPPILNANNPTDNAWMNNLTKNVLFQYSVNDDLLTIQQCQLEIPLPTNITDGNLTGYYTDFDGNYTNISLNDNSYWYFGSNNINEQPKAQAEIKINISDLIIETEDLFGLNFTITYCHSTDGLCNNNNASGTPELYQNVSLYNFSNDLWYTIGQLPVLSGNESNASFVYSGILTDFINSSSNESKVSFGMHFTNFGPQSSFLIIDQIQADIILGNFSTQIQEAINQNLTLELKEGTYNWKLACSDTLSNINRTTPRTLKVDLTYPQVSNTNANLTNLSVNGFICLNTTAFDAFSGINKTWARIKDPDSIEFDVQLYDNHITSCDNSIGDGIYSIDYQVSKPGQYNWTYTYVNDTAGNVNYTFTNIVWNSTSTGSLTVNLSSPITNIKINESDAFTTYSYNQTCNIVCDSFVEECTNVTIYAQYNLSGATDISTTTDYLVNLNNSLSCGNMTAMSSCNQTFTIETDQFSGNNVWNVWCKASSTNFGTFISSNSINITINDHPTPQFYYPQNNEWLHGIEILNASISYDDFSIVNYSFEIDNSTLFDSSSTLCSTSSENCTFDTPLQTQCNNQTLNCYLRLNVTDSDGLTSSTIIAIGIDNIGPDSNLTSPINFTNLSAHSYTLTANINDIGSGVNSSIFLYRVNETSNWTNACIDTTSPYSCIWNTTNLSDGNNYQIRVYANDSETNIGNNFTHYNITIDRTPPQIFLESPLNDTWSLQNNTFYFNTTDTHLNILSCSIILDNKINQTNSSIIENTSQSFTLSNIPQGNQYWSINCSDTLDNQNSSLSFLIKIDNQGPTTNIDIPSPYYNFSSDIYQLNASVDDSSGIGANTTLFYYRENNSASWNLICSDQTLPFGCLWDTSSLNEGADYQIRAYANDSLNNIGSFDYTLNITIDKTPPSINLLSPSNNTQDTDGMVTFQYNVDDSLLNIQNCSLIINQTINITDTSITKIATQSFQQNLSNGSYYWNVSCYDNAGNLNYSLQRYFSVAPDTTPPNITLISPDNNNLDTDGDVNFQFNVTDELSGIAACSLIINDTVNRTNTTTISEGIVYTFSVSGIEDGYYEWNINCSDNSPNQNIQKSNIRNLTISIRDKILVNVSTVNLNYQMGEINNITTNTTDEISNSLQTDITTNIILGNGSGVWSNTSFPYRKNISIIELDGSPHFDYPFNFTIDTESIIGLGKMENNCNDIRFAQDNGKPLSFWLVNGCNTTSTEIWVEMNLSAFETKTIYMYYGNDSSSNESNILFQEPILGEAGNISVEDFNFVWVNFSRNYSTTPVIIATPTSQNSQAAEDDNYPIPVLKDITTYGFNISVCADNGTSRCDTSTDLINMHWIAFNPDAITDEMTWISIGTTTNIGHSGADNTISFGKTMSTATPVVFASPQTYSQNYGEMAMNTWNDNADTTSTQTTGFAGCVHDASTSADVCSGGDSTETVGWVVLDMTLLNITQNQSGNANIADSTWTAASFSPAFTDPIVMVFQNDDDGAQDPQYPWARNVIGSGMDFRYCEQDGADDCDTHNDEVTHWFAVEKGDMTLFTEPFTLPTVEIGSEDLLVVTNASSSSIDGIWTWSWSTFNQTLGKYIAVSLAENINYRDGWNYTVFNIIADTTPPSINLNAPKNNSWFNTNNVFFNYTPSDNSLHILNCSLIINNTINQTNTTILNNQEYNFSLSNLNDETYSWQVNCTDFSFNTNNSELRIFNIDTEFPQIFLANNTPLNNSFLNQNYIFVNISAYDYNEANVTFFLYNQTNLINQTNFSDSTRFLNFTNLNSNKVYYYNVTIEDYANNKNSTLTRIITLDTTNPTIFFGNQTQENNSFLNQNYIFVNISAYDLNEANITFFLYNQTDLINQTNFSDSTRFLNFTNLNSNKVYYYNVTIEDYANNKNSTLTRIITLDTTNPSINLNNPQNNKWNTNGTIDFRYVVNDNNLDTCILYHNVSTWKQNKTNTTIESMVPDISTQNISDGIYLWNVWCNDSAGNHAFNSTNFTINIDTVYPSIYYNPSTYKNNTWYNTPYIFVNTTAIDSNKHTITFDWNETNETFAYQVGNLYWENKSSLIDGNYTFKVYVNDSAGHINSTEIRIIYIDTTSPSIFFGNNTKINNSFKNQDYIFVNISAYDLNEANITFFLYNQTNLVNQTNFSDSARFLNFTNLNPNSIYYYNITIEDYANNKNSTLTRIITLDNINPTMSFSSNSPPNNSFSSENYIFVNVSVNETNKNLTIFYLYNSSNDLINNSNSTTNTYFNFTNIDTNGIYYYNITHIDKAGNSNSTLTRIITLDNLDPGINFTQPTPNNNSNQTSSTLIINVTHIETNPDTSLIYLNDILNQSKLYTGLYSNFTISNLPDSIYTFYAWINDSSSNFNQTETRIIRIDSTPPSITLQLPQNNSWINNNTNPVLFEYIVSDNLLTIENCSLIINNTINLTNTTISESITQNFTQNFGNGNYSWQINCSDTLFNENSSFSNLIKIDTTFPTLTNPAINLTNTTVNNYICLNITVSDTYSGNNKTWVRIKDPDDIETTLLLYDNHSTTCDNLINDGIYSGLFRSSKKGVYNWTSVYSNDTAGNINYTFIGLEWNSSSENVLIVNMTYPTSNFLINESDTYSNYTYNQSCTVYCQAGAINCTNVYIYAQYNYSGVSDISNTTPYLVTSNLTHYCGNLTQGNTTSCNSTFEIQTTSYSGSTDWSIWCRAESTSVGSYISTQAINLTINDHPFAQFYYPLNGSWLNNLEILNASTSFDDFTIVEYTFEIDNNSFFNSSDIICQTTDSNCTLNTYTDQCLNESSACFIRLNITDNNGLKNSTIISIGIDNLPPRPGLISPLNNTWTNNSLIDFTYLSTDINLDTCILYHNEISWQSNETNNSLLSSQTDTSLITLSDGYYLWNIYCNDTLNNNAFNLTNYTINIDTKSPSILFGNNTELNNTFFNRNYILVNISLFEQNKNTTIFYLYNESLNLINKTIFYDSTIFVNFSNLPSNRVYYYNVTHIDKAENINSTKTRTITFDNAPPLLILDNPSNYSNISANSYTVNASVTDNLAGVNTTTFLYRENSTTQWKTACINTILPYNCVWNLTNLSDGNQYQIRAFSNDSIGNIGNNDTHYNITIDRISPSVTLYQPINNTRDIDGSIVFSYSVTDNTSLIEECSLIINNKVNQTNYSITKDITVNFTNTNIPEAQYNWSINCSDYSQNTGSSETWNFSIDYDQETPIINLTSPTNASIYTSPDITFIYQVNDTLSNIANCSLIFNNKFNQSNTSQITEGQSNYFTILNVANGNYSWSITCTDASEGFYNIGYSKTYNFTLVEATALNVSIILNKSQYEVLETPNIRTNVTDFFMTPIDAFVDMHVIKGNTTIPWWNSSYAYRKRINITNNISKVIEQNYTINHTINTSDLINQSKLKIDASDLRVVWFDNSTNTLLELDRLVTRINTSFTSIIFKIRKNITIGSSDLHYYIYYGADNPGTPPDSKSNIYYFYDKFDQDSLSKYTRTRPFSDSSEDNNNVLQHNFNGWINITTNTTVNKGKSARILSGLTDVMIEVDQYVTDYPLGRARLEIGSRSNGNTNYYFFASTNIDNSQLRRNNGTDDVLLTSTTNKYTLKNVWHNMKLIVFNNNSNVNIKAFVDNENIINYTDSSTSKITEAGGIGIGEFRLEGRWDNLTVKKYLYESFQSSNDDEEIIVLSNSSSIGPDGLIGTNFNLTNISLGWYTITSLASKTNYNNGFDLFNLEIVSDITSPYAILHTPINNFNTSSTQLQFNWTAFDKTDTNLTCNITVDGKVNISNISSLNGIPKNITINLSTDGLHYWNITCIDDANRVNSSETNLLTIIDMPININASLYFDNSSISINWTPKSYADYYEIYYIDNFSTEFSIIPNISEIIDSNWTDLTVSNSNQRFYKISTVKGSISKTSTEIVGKITTQLFNSSISPSGWNLISLPLSLNIMELNNGTNNGYDLPVNPYNCINTMWRFNLSSGWERTDYIKGNWTPGMGDENFTILEPGRSYWLEINVSCNLTFVGSVPTQNLTIPLNTGWNLNGWFTPNTSTLPESEPPTYPISVLPANSVQNIDRYDPLTESFEVIAHYDGFGWYPSFNNLNFTALEPTRGYYFDVTQNSIWTHQP